MKFSCITFFCSLLALNLSAQTNIFPASGNVGINVLTTPQANLEVYGINPYMYLSTSATTHMLLALASANGAYSAVSKLNDAFVGTQGNNTGDLILGSISPVANKGNLRFVTGTTMGGGTDVERMTILNNGKVGIGTSAPSNLLDVIEPNGGNAYIRVKRIVASGSSAGKQGLKIGDNAVLDVYEYPDYGGSTFNMSNGTGKINIGDFGAHVSIGGLPNRSFDNAFNLYVSGSSNFDGTMSIGLPGLIKPAGFRLYVADGILTEKIKVAVQGTANWSDFVFNKDYKLANLHDVESYIKKNKHLPEIPSAAEVVKEGIDLAKIDAKLLQKIEELTLYVIEINKKVEILSAENAKLKKQ